MPAIALAITQQQIRNYLTRAEAAQISPKINNYRLRLGTPANQEVVMRCVRYGVVYSLLAVAMLSAMACGETGHSKAVVGVILAETGDADFIGKPERDVLRALEDDYSKGAGVDLPFRLKFFDSGGNIANAIRLLEDLADDSSVVAVIGPSTSGEAIPMATRAEELRIPLLALAAARAIVVDSSGRTAPWAFKFAQNDSLAAEVLVEALYSRKLHQVALLYSDDGFGRNGAEAFRAAASRAPSITLCRDGAGFQASLDQPGPVIASLPARCEAVVIWGTAPGPALLVQELHRMRPTMGVFLSHGNASQDFLNSVGPAAEGALIVGSRVLAEDNDLGAGSQDETVLQYRSFWRQHFEGAPSHFGGHARDAFTALVALMRAGRKTRAAIRDGLEAMGELDGVTGRFKFTPHDHAGLTRESFKLYRVESGHFKPYDGP